MAVQIRRATTDDQLVIDRALFAAWHWREPFDEQAFAQHQAEHSPDSYIDNFGHRAGDLGMIADDDGAALGAAWYRFFTVDSHREGYVAEDVPELVIAIDERSRGQGLGATMTLALIGAARKAGIAEVSLHVSHENVRARGLYERLGFTDIVRGERGSVMSRSTDEDGPNASR